jgi:hydrogenase maturation protease
VSAGAAPRPLVLAIGNPLRGDDGAGPAAVRGLELDGADVVVAHQLVPEHAALVARAPLVVFVDARAGGAPGAIVEEPVAPGGASPLSHHLAPGQLLALATALHGAAPPAIALSIAAAELGVREGLSDEVRRALPRLRARLEALAGARRARP